MLSNLAETLHSQKKLENKQITKFEVSNSKNKDSGQQSSFKKVWKIALSIRK
jgi:hypothetical protein